MCYRGSCLANITILQESDSGRRFIEALFYSGTATALILTVVVVLGVMYSMYSRSAGKVCVLWMSVLTVLVYLGNLTSTSLRISRFLRNRSMGGTTLAWGILMATFVVYAVWTTWRSRRYQSRAAGCLAGPFPIAIAIVVIFGLIHLLETSFSAGLSMKYGWYKDVAIPAVFWIVSAGLLTSQVVASFWERRHRSATEGHDAVSSVEGESPLPAGLHVRTKSGVVEMSVAKAHQLYQEGKVADQVRCFSVDGGETWLCWSGVVEAMRGA